MKNEADIFCQHCGACYLAHPVDHSAACPLFTGVRCHRCDGDGKAHGSDRPFEWTPEVGYPGPCPVCKGTGIEPPEKEVVDDDAKIG